MSEAFDYRGPFMWVFSHWGFQRGLSDLNHGGVYLEASEICGCAVKNDIRYAARMKGWHGPSDEGLCVHALRGIL